MSELLPPMFDIAPPLVCSRWMVNGNCGKPATWHVIWTADMENGLCCDEHMAEVRREWAFYAAHPYEMVCSIRGCRFIEEENRCVVDDDDLGLEATESVAEPVPVGALSSDEKAPPA